MNRKKVGAIFKGYRQHIAELEKVRAIFRAYRRYIAELEGELDAASYHQTESCARLEHRIKACRNEQEQADRWYREDQIRSATKALLRARSYGDSWAEDRALKRRRSISL